MQEIWHILEHAILDTLKMSWLLLVFYILIELIEQKVAVKMHKKLKSKGAVLAGAGFGIVPQCGFSVLASDLYSKRQITVGTLLAVYIATSDEALPILFSSLNEKGVWLKLLMLILSKLVLALIAGYTIDAIVHFVKKKNGSNLSLNDEHSEEEHCHNHKENIKISQDGDSKALNETHSSQEKMTEVCQNIHHEGLHEHDNHDDDHDNENTIENHEHCEHDHENEHEEVDIHKGCCGHRIESGKYSTIKTYFVHPLLHTLKILAYILIINIIMGFILHFVGEDNIAEFMTKSGVFQPIIVTIVGLIPNCASSVLITELFLSGTISFGSALGGLIVNAGLGIAFLFKENKKNIKENLAITFGLFGFALIVAIIFHYAFINLF